LRRARALRPEPPAALPVYALPGAVDAVLALDRPRMLADAYEIHEFAAGDRFDLGPFTVDTWPLPHFVPTAARTDRADRTAGWRDGGLPGPAGRDPYWAAVARLSAG
jgi:hypothetical protein